ELHRSGHQDRGEGSANDDGAGRLLVGGAEEQEGPDEAPERAAGEKILARPAPNGRGQAEAGGNDEGWTAELPEGAHIEIRGGEWEWCRSARTYELVTESGMQVESKGRP